MSARWTLLLTALLWMGLTGSAQACAVCFGSPTSADTKALSYAILALLAVLGVVLACIVVFMVYLGRHSNGLPPTDSA